MTSAASLLKVAYLSVSVGSYQNAKKLLLAEMSWQNATSGLHKRYVPTFDKHPINSTPVVLCDATQQPTSLYSHEAGEETYALPVAMSSEVVWHMDDIAAEKCYEKQAVEAAGHVIITRWF